MSIIVGTAGWSVPAADRARFPPEGTALQRYAAVFRGVEINSSFHRRHRPSTWARWAATVPDGFRFSAKLPREISHVRKLVDCAGPLATFLGEVVGLGSKLSILLLQLPPKLAYDEAVADGFLAMLTAATDARIVCEPRHPSWFDAAADALLVHHRVARVAADPAPVPAAAAPGGWRGMTYRRLHGSPQMYRSAYGAERVALYAEELAAAQSDGRAAWCIFDNTAASAATSDALLMQAMVRSA